MSKLENLVNLLKELRQFGVIMFQQIKGNLTNRDRIYGYNIIPPNWTLPQGYGMTDAELQQALRHLATNGYEPEGWAPGVVEFREVGRLAHQQIKINI